MESLQPKNKLPFSLISNSIPFEQTIFWLVSLYTNKLAMTNADFLFHSVICETNSISANIITTMLLWIKDFLLHNLNMNGISSSRTDYVLTSSQKNTITLYGMSLYFNRFFNELLNILLFWFPKNFLFQLKIIIMKDLCILFNKQRNLIRLTASTYHLTVYICLCENKRKEKIHNK